MESLKDDLQRPQRLKSSEEFSSLKKSHGLKSSNGVKHPLKIPETRRADSFPLDMSSPQTTPRQSTPQKKKRRKPLIPGANHIFSTLDHNRRENNREKKKPPISLRDKRFAAYRDGRMNEDIAVELKKVDGVRHLFIGSSSRPTNELVGSFEFSTPASFSFYHNGQLWQQFRMDTENMVPFRCECGRYGLRVKSADGKPGKAEYIDTNKQPLSKCDTRCLTCIPEPSKGKITGQRLHLMLNEKGVHFSGSCSNGASFFRNFPWKEIDVEFHRDEQQSEFGTMQLKREEALFEVEFMSTRDYEELQKQVRTKQPASKSPYFTSADSAAPESANPSPEIPETPHKRGAGEFDEIAPADFYSSPASGHTGSKRPKSSSSPRGSTDQDQVSPRTKELDSPTRAEKPSQRFPRARRQINVETLDLDAIVEPSETDIDDLVKQGYRPLSYPFRQGKPMRVGLADIVRLNPHIYLNDNIIWFYMRLYLERLMERDPAMGSEVLMLDTFFYFAMRSPTSGSVPSWVSKLEFDKKPIIFLPIHDNSHWALAMVIGLDEAVRQNDRQGVEKEEVYEQVEPTIIILDSLGPSRSHNTMRKVTTALGIALKAQGRPALTYKQYRSLRTDVPTQDNLTDCGVFLLHYVEQILGNMRLFLSRVNESQERNIAFGPDFWRIDDLAKKREAYKKELFDLAHSPVNLLRAGEQCGPDESDDIIEVVEEAVPKKKRVTLAELSKKHAEMKAQPTADKETSTPIKGSEELPLAGADSKRESESAKKQHDKDKPGLPTDDKDKPGLLTDEREPAIEETYNKEQLNQRAESEQADEQDSTKKESPIRPDIEDLSIDE